MIINYLFLRTKNAITAIATTAIRAPIFDGNGGLNVPVFIVEFVAASIESS